MTFVDLSILAGNVGALRLQRRRRALHSVNSFTTSDPVDLRSVNVLLSRSASLQIADARLSLAPAALSTFVSATSPVTVRTDPNRGAYTQRGWIPLSSPFPCDRKRGNCVFVSSPLRSIVHGCLVSTVATIEDVFVGYISAAETQRDGLHAV